MGWKNIGQVLVFNSRNSNATYNITTIMDDVGWLSGTDTNSDRVISTSNVSAYDSSGFTLDGYAIYGRTTTSPRTPTWWYDTFITTVVWARRRGTIFTQKFIKGTGIRVEWSPGIPVNEQIDFEGLFTGGVHTVLVVPIYNRKDYEILYYDYNGYAVSGSTTYLPGVGSWLRGAITTRDGYRHTHWRDNVTNNTYATGSNVTLTTMNTRSFIAVYAIIPYTIRYNNLNGTTHNNITTYNINTSPVSLSVPTSRPGYTFAGWYNHISSGDKISSIGGGEIGDLTLYARWTPITYNITINSNGGTSVNGSTYNIETTSVVLNEPTRDGYTINGWAITSYPTSGSPTISLNRVTINGSYGHMTIRANWRENILTASFDINGAVGTTPQSIASGYTGTIKLPSLSANKSGYSFTRWRYNGIDYEVGQTVSTSSLNDDLKTQSEVGISFAAQWTPVEYSIIFNVNGGDSISNLLYTIETSEITLPTPTKKGHTFNGWTRTSGLNPGVVSESDDTVTLNKAVGNINYSAKWTPNVLTLSFSLGGGDGTVPDEIETHYDSTFKLPNANGFYRTGYTFTYWNIGSHNFNAGSSTKPSAISNDILTGDASLEMTATWTPTAYSISFDSKGGSPKSSIEYDILKTEISLPTDPTRSGYNFVRWDITTPPTPGEASINADNDKIELSSAVGNIVLTAVWKTIDYTITWGDTGGTDAFPTDGEFSLSKPLDYNITTPEIITSSFIGTLTRPGWSNPVFAPASIDIGSTGNKLVIISEWKALTYNITIYSTGTGYAINNNQYSSSQTDGASVTRTLTRGSRSGYTHGYWSITRTGVHGGATPTTSDNTLTIPSGSYGPFTVTQTFTVILYNITYNYSGSDEYPTMGAITTTGTPNVAPSTYTVESNITYLTGTLVRPGWSYDVDWIQISNRPTGSNTIPQGSIDNRTVTINWVPNTYNITLLGAYNGTAIASNTYSTLNLQEDVITIQLTRGTRTGYTDNGWTLSRAGGSGGGSPEINNNIITIPTGSYGAFTVNKVWVANTYTISYNTNGAGTLPNKSATYDKIIGTLPTPPDEKVGYTFDGWTINGTAVTSNSENLTSTPNGTVTLDAVWTPITYTIQYQTNDGRTISSKSATYDKPIGVLPPRTKVGYTFEGWYKSNGINNGTGDEVKSDSINLRNTSGTVTIYGKWTASTHTITYQIAKHTGTLTGTNTYITGGNNSPLHADNIKVVIPAATEPGWDFTGRTVDDPLVYTHSSTHSSGTLTIPSNYILDININANWSPKTYTITRPVNKTTNTTFTYQTSNSEQIITIPGSTNPGWISGVKIVTPSTLEITNETGSDSSTLTIPANHYGDITIGTTWTGVKYTITVNPDNGKDTTSIEYTTSKDTTNKNISATPTKHGYERNGWSLASNPSSDEVTISGNQISIPANTYGNFGVKMTWVLENYNYSVKFSEDTTDVLSGSYNWGITVNRTFTVPTKSNQTLMGYSYTVTAGQSAESNIRSRFTPTEGYITPNLNAINLPQGTYGSIALTAIWSGIFYRVTFDKNGATNGSMGTQDRSLGDDKELTSNKYSEARYTFAGWGRLVEGPVHYTDKSTANIAKSNGNLPTSTNKDVPDEITLYAKWSAKHLRIGNKSPVAIKVNSEEVISKYSSTIVWNKDLKISE